MLKLMSTFWSICQYTFISAMDRKSYHKLTVTNGSVCAWC